MIADNDAPQLGCRGVAFVAADSTRDTVRSWEVMEAQSKMRFMQMSCNAIYNS
jgi:hypothetical protein